MINMTTHWVVGVWKGEAAKSITLHANAGIGYILIEQGGRGTELMVKAAFRHADDSPLQPNLRLASYAESRKFEGMRNK
jgi:hypothetical protein